LFRDHGEIQRRNNEAFAVLPLAKSPVAQDFRGETMGMADNLLQKTAKTAKAYERTKPYAGFVQIMNPCED
jgi:hypothetical protein